MMVSINCNEQDVEQMMKCRKHSLSCGSLLAPRTIRRLGNIYQSEELRNRFKL